MGKPLQRSYDAVAEKDGLILYSWMQRSLRFYGIAVLLEDGTDKIVEQFSPTSTVRGNALRSRAVKTFNARVKNDYQEWWPITATCVEEVSVGDVIVTNSPSGPGELYLVTEVTPTVLFAQSRSRNEAPWTRSRLNAQIVSGECFVTDFQALPARFQAQLTFLEESHSSGHPMGNKSHGIRLIIPDYNRL